MLAGGSAQTAPPQQLRHSNQARSHPIVDVVGVVGDRICQVAQLRFQTGLSPRQKTPPHPTRLALFQMLGIRLGAMFEHPFTGFKAQIQPIKIGVALFEFVHHPQALQVVLKTTVFGHARVECVLSCMAKRCVAQVVCQRNGFDQIFIQAQDAGN